MVERTFKHPIFRFNKGQPKQCKTALQSNNTAKIGTIFVIANFIQLFFLSPMGQSSPYKKLKIIWIVKLFFVSLHP